MNIGVRNVGSKRETVSVLVRLPLDVKQWLEREAARNAGSQNSEIVRSLRARMDLPGVRHARRKAP
jgi:hypothetical protein